MLQMLLLLASWLPLKWTDSQLALRRFRYRSEAAAHAAMSLLLLKSLQLMLRLPRRR
jgi:hypothetical protein